MDGPPLKEGPIFGVASFVVGYILTLIVVVLGEAEEFTENLVEATGWIYYNAQFADVKITASSGDQTRSETFNYLTDDTIFSSSADALDVPAVVYHLLPVLILIGAGFLLARYANARDASDGALAGSTLALGTVLPALLGTVLFSVEQAGFLGSVEVSPELFTGVLFVGLLFPAVFGAIGGVLGAKL
jgi:hypothetical protein